MYEKSKREFNAQLLFQIPLYTAAANGMQKEAQLNTALATVPTSLSLGFFNQAGWYQSFDESYLRASQKSKGIADAPRFTHKISKKDLLTELGMIYQSDRYNALATNVLISSHIALAGVGQKDGSNTFLYGLGYLILSSVSNRLFSNPIDLEAIEFQNKLATGNYTPAETEQLAQKGLQAAVDHENFWKTAGVILNVGVGTLMMTAPNCNASSGGALIALGAWNHFFNKGPITRTLESYEKQTATANTVSVTPFFQPQLNGALTAGVQVGF
ncbi:MAG: hypothetical protein AB7F43_15265 [Bacteriovoracia bacterium]